MRTSEFQKKIESLQQEAADLKHAQKALEESEEKYRNLVENIPDVIYSIDSSFTVAAINLPASEFYGFKAEEVLGHDFLTFIHPDDKARVSASFIEAMDTHREWTRGLQFRVVSKDGVQYWVELNSHMQFDEDGNFSREEGVLRDINERKKAEDELKQVYDELEQRIQRRTKELVGVNKQLQAEIKERLQAEKKLKKLHDELEKRVERRTSELAKSNLELELKTENLKEANTALKVLLKRRDEDQAELEEKILANVNELIAPLINTLRDTMLNKQQSAWLEILEANLSDIVSPFSRGLNSKYWKLTPMEFQVANFVKNGKTTKEIAKLLGVATSTVDTYRNNIRKKIGIQNKKVNLKTYLLNIK